MSGSEQTETGSTRRPRFSVVIPHLNERENLRQCLTALAAASKLHSIEVIVADNGSSPPPYSVCGAFPSTRLVIEKTPGPGPARNTGAALARGEIICFIDSDCFVAKNYFDICWDYFQQHPEIAFVGGGIGIWPSNPPELGTVEAFEAVFSYRTKMFVERDNYAATGNMVVRREAFLAVGPFAGIGQHEDRVWGQKAVAMGFNIAHLPEALVLTPGCTQFSQLASRIERHVAHDYLAQPEGLMARIRWIAFAGLMVLSPPAGIRAILECPQTPNNWLRLRVFACLCRSRAYRARLMLEVMRGDSDSRLANWNRTKTPNPVDPLK